MLDVPKADRRVFRSTEDMALFQRAPCKTVARGPLNHRGEIVIEGGLTLPCVARPK